ncbi:alpha-glycosidase [Exiguobacterium sp. RIT452]|uniref:glycoside hydrolase family 13 protein n=1 Tax=Exiguobacterium sp. RIT452 TaxID=2315552 RepID=UPI000E71F4F1|nr:glycoside hydrolase family 13 protein [Exiguobacterium sp. RIT452]RJP01847.1 alpha-glycosidase [Exiguobacterium sp. RIT452]
MLKEAVFHRAMSPFVYKYDEKTIHIRLQTKKNDVDHVELIWGDPYDWHTENPDDADWNFDPSKANYWNTFETPMKRSGSDELYDYWFIDVVPPFRRLRYGFRLHDGSSSLVFTERGWFDEKPLDDTGYYFCVPYLNKIDVFHAPNWVQDTVWYQIFPDRFANGDSSNDPAGTLPWNSAAPTTTNLFGGDFQGVIDQIDYLVDLGITGIYFCPIFEAKSNHKYDTIDYLEIDPQFGTKEKFKEMVDLLHEKGIRIMLDAVFNHAGFHHKAFADIREHGSNSSYKDWFHLRNFPLVTEPMPNYDTFAFVPEMPKFNTENPEVKAYLLHVARYWVEEFGIDGWRLDVANEVDHAFWRDFRNVVKEVNPDTYILGEIWHDSQEWLLGDQFDAVMNYPFTNAALNFFALDKTSASAYANEMSHVLFSNTMNVNEVTFNLIGSHDTPRALTRAGHDKNKMRLLLLSMLTFSGSPVIYYGDEIGLDGDQDPGCRKCMPWDPAEQDLNLLMYTKHLLHLRSRHKTLANQGHISFVHADDETNTIVMRRISQDGTYYVYFNNSNRQVTIAAPQAGQGMDLFSNTPLLSLDVTLAPFTGTIVQVI